MDAQTVRCKTDRLLAEQLLKEERIQKIREHVEKQAEAGGTRRELLAKALRLTPEIAPDLYGLVDRCKAALGVETEVELYIYASPTFNAACTQQEGDRVFVLLSSALREALDAEELAYVIGHELGHHLYDHHDIPVQLLMNPQDPPPPQLLLTAHSWMRHAEISADRAGMLCCGGLGPAARSLFKLSSGLSRAPSDAQIDAFIAQAAELYAESTERSDKPADPRHADWLSTHPFSPIRLQAAQIFARSAAFEPEGLSMDQIEVEVLDVMALMEPSYLEGRTPIDEAMRRLLFVAGILLAGADGEIAPKERAALETLMGPGSVPRRLDLDRLRQVLNDRTVSVREKASPAKRAQLVRDLALIARADGHIAFQEVLFMEGLARGLEVDPGLVRMALAAPMEVD